MILLFTINAATGKTLVDYMYNTGEENCGYVSLLRRGRDCLFTNT